VPSFSEFFQAVHGQLEALAEISQSSGSVEDVVKQAEANRGLSPEEVARLIAWGRQADRREEIHAAAHRLRDGSAERIVEFIIPVYLTSFCENDCLYCGYRKSNPLAERVRLSLEDFERELDLILSWGHRQIELVLSEDAELPPARLVSYVELTRKKLDRLGGGKVALCAPIYEEDDYRLLRAAGLDWIAEWQETYHQPHFDRWHFPGSPKRHYEARLDIWDRAIRAGFTQVGLGVLLGLYAWPFDVLAVVEHANYLRRTYGVTPHTIGIPRLKPARGVLASQKPSRFTVSDEDYRFVVSLYHLAFPDSRLFFNTRETYEFNLSMVAAGDLFTVDCETLPGGYLRTHLPGQFRTHYYPPRREVLRAFEQRGFRCMYLAEETAAPTMGSLATVAEMREGDDAAQERWRLEHELLRSRLADWEGLLGQLRELPAADPGQRKVAVGQLREVLRFFETTGVEHFRREESGELARLARQNLPQERLAEFRAEHERFGIDLDRFARQVISYEQSGDPTVLVMLGGRMIRELREHLEAEERLSRRSAGLPEGEARSAGTAASR